MRLQHERVVAAPVDDVWEAFVDLRRVGACFPGAKVTSFDGTDFEGHVTVRLGPFSFAYDGAGQLASADADRRRAVVRAKGQERHGLGKADIVITVDLEPAGDSDASTQVHMRTDLTVKGAPTSLAGGVAQRVSDPLIAAFLDCLGSGRSPGGDALDLGRSVLPGLVTSYGRSLRSRLGGRRR